MASPGHRRLDAAGRRWEQFRKAVRSLKAEPAQPLNSLDSKTVLLAPLGSPLLR